MRQTRIKSPTTCLYHCMSRTCAGERIFNGENSLCIEAIIFVRLMRRLADFMGIQILTYALMSNHYHILCEVPEPYTLTDDQLLDRIEAFYGSKRRKVVAAQLKVAIDNQNNSSASEIRTKFLRRMFDISIFNQELKSSFAQGYNKRHVRFGALWAERFASSIVQPGIHLQRVGAYIDLNPLRAGICQDPKDYRFCGYAEAIVAAHPTARPGIRQILSIDPIIDWKETHVQYRQLLLDSARRKAELTNGSCTDSEFLRRVQENGNETLSESAVLMCQIRYFTHGMVIGSKEFVETHLAQSKDRLGYKCIHAAHRIPFFPDLWVLRKPRRSSINQARNKPTSIPKTP
jgi:putative transposase